MTVDSFQPVAPIVSSYTTTTVRELNDDSCSLYLSDLATDLYSSFHRSPRFITCERCSHNVSSILSCDDHNARRSFYQEIV
jgi:hypothetical protein